MADQKKFSEKAKQYYSGKKMWGRYLVLGVLIFLVAVQLLGKNPSQKDIQVQSSEIGSEPQVNYKNISFAGEQVSFEEEGFFNRERLDREVAITLLNPAQFVMIHKREPLYLPHIEKELEKAGIPDDFKYLPVAESALRNVAYSHVGAAGIRQFMPDTAERYGLIVNDDVDERLDFEKSTEAAIKYLSDLYDHFGNWTLAAAAYNRGENGLQRDMSRQQVDNYYDLWLNQETSRYVFRIIAIKEIMENREAYFSEDVLGAQYEHPNTKTIKVKELVDVAERAKEQGSSYNQVRRLNPWIVGNILDKGKREIKLFKK